MIEMDMPKLEVLENDDSYAKIVCEPLEKGFGLALGEYCFPLCPARLWKGSNFWTAA